MPEPSILRGEGLVKRFGGLVAVNNVSFDVKKGEIFGIIGPNGAGKTTLFNVVSGVYKPEAGRVYFEGRDITPLSPHERARLGLARTHQVVKPFPGLTVLENIAVGALFGTRHGRITLDEALEIAREVADFVGLGGKSELPASALNVQEKKRLELARALASEPKVLLLDEVLAGLTPSEIGEMLKLLRRVRDERNVTIVMIEHVMHAIMNLAERIMVLHFGRKIAEGTPEEIANNPDVITVYLGDPSLALKLVKRRGGA